MKIRITNSVYNGMVEHAQKETPIEACGYLAGKEGVINQYYAMKNIDNSPEHFSFDPVEQFGVLNKTRADDLVIMANYHSHPATPSRPSEEDIKLAYDPNIFYLIVSLAEDKPAINAFKIVDGLVEKIQVIVEN